MKSKTFPSLALALGLMAQNGQAADIVSGPPTDTPLAPVNSYALHGPHKGREFDAAKSLGQGPGALLFIHELTRNIIPVLRGLDDLTSEYSVLGFQSHTLLLHDDRTSAENRLKAINGSLKYAHPIILSLDGLEGLLSFLGARPYADEGYWTEHVRRPLTRGTPGDRASALDVARRAAADVVFRSPKAVASAPRRPESCRFSLKRQTCLEAVVVRPGACEVAATRQGYADLLAGALAVAAAAGFRDNASELS